MIYRCRLYLRSCPSWRNDRGCELMRAMNIIASMILTVGLAACEYGHSELYDKIVRVVESDPVSTQAIYDQHSSTLLIDLQDIEKLTSFGFAVDVGEFPGKSYVNCGDYRLPVNDPWIIARQAPGPHGYGYRVTVISDAQCKIATVTAVSLPIARF